MVGPREPPTDGGHLKGMCRGKAICLLKIEKYPEEFTSFINDVNICLLLKDNGQALESDYIQWHKFNVSGTAAANEATLISSCPIGSGICTIYKGRPQSHNDDGDDTNNNIGAFHRLCKRYLDDDGDDDDDDYDQLKLTKIHAVAQEVTMSCSQN
ncbi:hypothetical protein TURU_011435 [Turdus rufiventris]|nr:hypothetical protein TURU_011435 [Turdus rufiventris]